MDIGFGNYSENDNYALFGSPFKGVVKLPNGHWGTQIYANHHCIWLGKFKSEEEAATAYDSAALKLFNTDFKRNFPLSDMTIHEPNFQGQYTSEAVLDMIKDGSYPSKFIKYLFTQVGVGQSLTSAPLTYRPLFRKELTPSDIGKLNRLVIPKKYALEYFPPIDHANNDEVELAFFDSSMRCWRFRYGFWKSSQSFVFTRGWTRFVKEKGLKAKDWIVFSVCELGPTHGSSEARTVCMIHVVHCNGLNGDDIGQLAGESGRGEEVDEMDVRHSGVNDDNASNVQANGGNSGFRLFGVQIK